jgi:capsular polysaccharide biosynthesis protein
MLSPTALTRLGPPRGTFSAWEKLQRGEVEGQVILKEQHIGSIASDAMRIQSGLGQDGHQPWPIFWTHEKEIRLIGKTLVPTDHAKRACLEAMYCEHHFSDPAFRTLTLPKAKRMEGAWTSLTSRWWHGSASYYHWLMDALPRLAVLETLPPEIKVIVSPGLAPFQRDTLKWLGLERRYEETVETHLLVEDYYFSAPTAMTGCTNPYAVEFLRTRFLPKADPDIERPRKIYITRKGKTRGIVNEAEVIALLVRDGWQVVDGEGLSIAQQIGLFSAAEQVCGVHGAGFTNILWCPPGCRVIEIMADTFKNGCYEAIAACLNMRHSALVFAGDTSDRVTVDLGVLQRHLAQAS